VDRVQATPFRVVGRPGGRGDVGGAFGELALGKAALARTRVTEWHRNYDQADFATPDSTIVGELTRSWLSPFAVGQLTQAHHRAQLTERFTPHVLRELDKAAGRFLEEQNIIGEPVTWSPPLSILEGLELPGPDPTSIPIEDLHRIVAEKAMPISVIARHFQVPTSAIRHLLETSPPPNSQRLSNGSGRQAYWHWALT